MDNFLVQKGKIMFSLEVPGKLGPPTPLTSSTTDARGPREAITTPPIKCYPRPESFYAALSLAPLIHIGQCKGVKVIISTGSNNIIRGNVVLRSASTSLNLKIADTILETGGPFLHSRTKPRAIEFETLPNDLESSIIVPFESEPNMPCINMRLEVFYLTNQGEFVFTRASNVNTELLLDVNVQDAFKRTMLLSKFLFRPMRGEILRLNKASLTGHDIVEVQDGPGIIKDSVIVSDKPVSKSYYISFAKTRHDLETSAQKVPCLTLILEYFNLADQFSGQATAAFARDLEKTNFWQFRYLLIPLLADAVRKSYTHNQFSQHCGRLKTISYDDVNWTSLLDTLPSSIAPELNRWIMEWHAVRGAKAKPRL